jgi:DNA polymerase III subunit delta'
MTKLYPWQDELWKRWVVLRDRMPQALLLKGAEGIGKLNFALNMAQSLLCVQPLNNTAACQICPACHWFTQQSHPDFKLIQPAIMTVVEDDKAGDKKPARQITIEQIRSLTDFASLSAHQSGYRVVIIHPAEMMNNNSANALLKILEEPPKQMLILLISHRPQRLLPTIRSRCLAFPIPLPSLEIAVSWLQQQKLAAPMDFLAQTGFSPLLAIQLAENAQVNEQYHHFIQEILQPEKVDVYALSDYLKGTEPIKMIHWLQQWCYDLIGCKLTGKVRYFPEQTDLINKLTAGVDIHRVLQYQSKLTIAKRESLHPLNPKLLYESILLAYQQAMRSAV